MQETHAQPANAESEAAARLELAAAYRLAAREGLDDGIWNHFSLALPGRDDRFLLKPHGLLFSEVRASDLIIVDLDGQRLSGQGLWEPTAFYIHARLHRARPHLRCVMHSHMPHLAALAACGDKRLLPLSQDSLRFYGRLAYYERYNGLALDEAEGDRMVEALGDHSILILANHGVLVGAPDVARAFYDLHYLEQACRLQLLSRQMAAGGPLQPIDPETARRTAHDLNRNVAADAALHLAAYRRRLEREEPDYRT
jgi:ribulose-5-phosphate 4-epimerase/fuculose-1-phosphate aldolase